MTPNHVRAHRHSIQHRDELLASEQCGCFYCLATFPPADIRRWADACKDRPEGDTAVCPRCGIDAVIGSASGYPLTAEFLGRMHQHWFGTVSAA
jgi:hypothetical protein